MKWYGQKKPHSDDGALTSPLYLPFSARARAAIYFVRAALPDAPHPAEWGLP